MEVRFRKLPMTFDQYKERKARVDESFLDLQRDTFVVSQRLKGWSERSSPSSSTSTRSNLAWGETATRRTRSKSSVSR